MNKLVSGDFTAQLGLYVTESFALAARYANSQADRAVHAETHLWRRCAVVVEIETDEAVRWQRRSADHATLDVCEALIRRGRVVALAIVAPDRLSYQEQRNIEQVRALLPEARITVVEPAER